MTDSEDKPGISRRLTTPFRWVWRQIMRLANAFVVDLQLVGARSMVRRLTAPVRWVWRQVVRLASAYVKDLRRAGANRWFLIMLRWTVPGVALIVGLFWLPFDLMPLGRMRTWVWEGNAQEFRNALWGVSAVVGVLLAMAGILLNYIRTRAIDKQAHTAEGRLAAEEEGRRTERYVRAVELLGHEEIAVRLGALYSLERLAKDSPSDQPTIIETIAAYVREQVPRNWTDWEDKETEIHWPKVREDIVAAISIISRRDRAADGVDSIDLSHTNLMGLHLPGARLEKLNLADTNLQDAYLGGADLQNTFFGSADMQRATLVNANLKDADLEYCSLRYARLNQTNLQYAVLAGADLSNASLYDSNLKYSNLTDAKLNGAYLVETNLQKAILRWAVLSGAKLDQARHLTQKQLTDVRYSPDKPPDLPDGLTLPSEEKNLILQEAENETEG